MNVLAAFGRILARAALFRALRRSPIAVAILAALVGFALVIVVRLALPAAHFA